MTILVTGLFILMISSCGGEDEEKVRLDTDLSQLSHSLKLNQYEINNQINSNRQ